MVDLHSSNYLFSTLFFVFQILIIIFKNNHGITSIYVSFITNIKKYILLQEQVAIITAYVNTIYSLCIT